MARIACGPASVAAIASSATEAASSPVTLGGLFTAYGKGHAARYKYLLLFRFAVINLVGAALLGGAYFQGWIALVLGADATHLSVAIFGVFVAGLAVCADKVWRTSHELNLVRSPRPTASSRVARYLREVDGRGADSRAISAAALRLKLFSRIAVVRHTATGLVFLGLIGTVVGFIIALSGIEPDAAADPSAIGPMVSTLIQGMSVALYTTLVGAVFNVWLMVNFHVLATGTVNLVTAVVERGERHGSV